MAHTYSKLFSQIVGSTIWAEDHPTRIVWITLLAMKDRFGEVNGTPVGLARIANVSLEECNAALAKFLAPEPSRHDDGRRIEEIEHGWYILNHDKYQRLASKEDSQERNAERQRRFKKKHGVRVTKANAQVTHDNDSVTLNRDISDADAEVDTEAESKKKKDHSAVNGADKRGSRLPEDWQLTPELRAFASDLGLDPDGAREEFVDYWTALPGSRGLKLDWGKTFRNRCREIAKKVKPNGGFRKPDPQAMPPEEPWEARMRGWRQGGQWLPMLWGPRPGTPGCRVPKHLLGAES